jgi:hypothetical protein
MAFDAIQAEIALLLNQMQNQPEDARELAAQIHAKLQEMKAFGMPLPADLVDLDAALQSDPELPDQVS